MKNLFALAVFSLASMAFSESTDNRYLGLNMGFGLSKNFLGAYYSWNRNQINAGTDVIVFVPEEGLLLAQPSITYNRYLTASGIYAMLGLLTTYAPDSYEVYAAAIPPETQGTYHTVKRSSWRTPLFLIGAGKNFQFTSWGLYCDASLLTPLDNHIGRMWGIWIGGGVSYRFRLGN
jgi:hypothetical protein